VVVGVGEGEVRLSYSSQVSVRASGGHPRRRTVPSASRHCPSAAGSVVPDSESWAMSPVQTRARVLLPQALLLPLTISFWSLQKSPQTQKSPSWHFCAVLNLHPHWFPLPVDEMQAPGRMSPGWTSSTSSRSWTCCRSWTWNLTPMTVVYRIRYHARTGHRDQTEPTVMRASCRPTSNLSRAGSVVDPPSSVSPRMKVCCDLFATTNNQPTWTSSCQRLSHQASMAQYQLDLPRLLVSHCQATKCPPCSAHSPCCAPC
jgi:hypothetical protein